MKLITLTAACIVLMTCAETGLAATHYVATNGANASPFTNGWGSAATDIQSAVYAAANGDTVLISNGVYVLTARISVAGISITVRGFSGNPNDVIITGNGAAIGGLLVRDCNTLVANLPDRDQEILL